MRRRRLAFAIVVAPLVVLACDGFGADEAPPSMDAGAGEKETGASVDASPVTNGEAAAGDAGCDPRGAFTGAVVLTSLNTPLYSESRPTLTADELVIVFSRRPIAGGTPTLARSMRSSREEPFPEPQPIVELEPFAANNVLATPAISGDGLDLTFTVTAFTGTELAELATVHRTQRTDPFSGTPTPLTKLNSPKEDRSPSYAANAQQLFFNSNRHTENPALNFDAVFVSQIFPGGFDTPEAVISAQNQPLLGLSPTTSADGAFMYVGVYDEAPPNRLRIVMADLATGGRSVSNVQPVSGKAPGSINADSTAELPGFLSADHCRLYFSASTSDAGDSFDLWMATRPAR